MRAALQREAVVVILTPGMANSAYFEHSFLAARWAWCWSRAATDRRGQLRLHATTQGKQKVDVIYRRVDDDFIDPLTFRATVFWASRS